MKVVISAGGTGGHIYPALAIIEKIKKEEPDSEFLYIGTTNRMEKDIIPKKGIPYFGIEIYGLKRKLTLSNFKSISKFISSISKCKKEIKKFNPDIVIGAGGYVTAPVIYAAKKCKYKTLVHEQNSILGLSNKMLLKYTDTLCTSFEKMKPSSVNYVYTGNPCTENAIKVKAFNKEDFGLDKDKKTVLIVMGSLGSSTINKVLLESLDKFYSKEYQVLIVTGKNYYESYKKIIKNKNVIIKPYIDELIGAIKFTDVLVTRAGATTLAEILGSKVPSILIPSPYVTENHQYKNAMSLVSKNAALLIEEENLTVDRLIKQIDYLIEDKNKYKEIKNNLGKMQISDSLDRIYKEIVKLTNNTK